MNQSTTELSSKGIVDLCRRVYDALTVGATSPDYATYVREARAECVRRGIRITRTIERMYGHCKNNTASGAVR